MVEPAKKELTKEQLKEQGYDSEEAEDLIEEEKHNPEYKVELTGTLPAKVANLIIATPAHAGALIDIVLDGKHKQVGAGSVIKPKDDKDSSPKKEDKPKELFKIYTTEAYGGNIYVQIQPESKIGTPLQDKLFETLKGVSIGRILCLHSQYKTTYSTLDTGHYTQQGMPLVWYKSSHVASDSGLTNFIAKHQPSSTLNIMGGLLAGALIHAELNGLPGAIVTGIVDQHYVTSETLQAFTPVVKDLLGATDVNMDQIFKHSAFKKVLTVHNERDNTIFN